MSTIDERVVAMKFDNAQFSRGVADTTKSLDGLKNSLKMDGSTKGLENIDAAAKRFSLAAMSQSVQDISNRFTTMSMVAITALTNITNRAVDAGINLARSLTVAPIMDGFREYELKMGSIQTILANTSKDGTTLNDVKNSLEELNTYADKTIYNFGDMTRNIGLFTNAGIKLQDATDMIKGFSNEAAASGTSSASAAGAAYQLSQALSKGKITLEDWRSLTNAGMGNKNMQNGLIDIAKAMNTFSGKGIDATAVAKDFNGSLEKGWLTADVMQNYLKIQAGELSAEQMKTLGLADDQIESFLKQQKIAEEAATKVRTWTALIGTLQEGVGSSWATTWELLLGDFDEATVLFTGVSNTLGKIIGDAGEARNNLIKEWVGLGGRAIAIDGIKNMFDSIMALIAPIRQAFTEIFPPVTAQNLLTLTQNFKNFTESLKPSAQTLDYVKRIAKGLFAALDIGLAVIQALWGQFQRLWKNTDGTGNSILDFAAKIGDWLVKVRDAVRNGEDFSKFFVQLGDWIQKPINVLKKLGDLVKKVFDGFNEASGGAAVAVDNLQAKIKPLEGVWDRIKGAWQGFIDWLKDVGQFFKPIGDFFSNLGKTIGDSLRNLNFDQALAILNTGLLAGLVLLFKRFFGGGLIEQLKSIFGGSDKPGLLDTIKEAFGGLTDTLKTMQNSLKAGMLITIAIAIGILTASLVALSNIDSEKLKAALAAMAIMFTQLLAAMVIFEKISIASSLANMASLGVAMVLVAIAINILADAVKKLGDMDWESLGKGLIGVTVLLGGLAAASRIMSKYAVNLISTAVGLVIVAGAIKILATAVKTFGDMDMKTLMKGLGSVMIMLGSLALFTRLSTVSPGAIGQATSIVILAAAVKIMASAVKDFGSLDLPTLVKGVAALDILLAQIVLFIKWTQNSVGMIATATGVVILAAGLKILATVITDLGNMDFKVLAKGLLGMAAALVIIAAAMNMLPPNMIINAAALVIVAAGLKIIASVMKDFGGMSWEEVAKGLVMLAGSLLIIALATAAMSGAVVGALAMIVVAGALALMGPVLVAFGKMSWDEIGRGLTMLGASLLVLGLAALVLTPVLPSLLLLGVAIGLLGLGALMAGAGMALFAAGLTAMAVAGGAATVVLIATVRGLLDLIPYAMEQFAKGLVGFAQVMQDSAPALIDSATVLISSLLTAINTLAPQIVKTLFDLVMMLLQTLVDNIPKFVDAGLKILIGFLQGIANNIGQVVTTATDVIVNFLNGIANNLPRIIEAGVNIIVKFLEGVGKESPRIVDAGAKMIVDFVNGVAKAIENNSGAMREAGGRIGMAIADGMSGGLASKTKNVIDGAIGMAKGALDAAKAALDSHSPSREFGKLGAWSAQGYANELVNNSYLAEDAASGMGESAIDMLKKTMSKVGSTLNDDIDMTPVIRPVLDLSLVKKDAGSIGSMFKTPQLAVDGMYAKATSLLERERIAKQNAEAQAEAQQQIPAPVEAKYEFKQYNSSPKSLSEAEIYRNTKNLISAAKGDLDK